MSQAQVRGLLNKALSTYLVGKDYVAKWDNVFAPQTTKPVLEVHLMPSLNKSSSLSGDLEEFFGLYQITVVTKLGEGDGVSDTIIGDLHKVFKANKEFTSATGFKVQVTTPVNVAEGRTEGSTFWRVPCWFEYRAATFTKDTPATDNTVN